MKASDDDAAQVHRTHAINANNATWDLLGAAERSDEETDEMLHRAHAAAYHWARAARREPVNAVRADYLVAKAWAAAGEAGPAMRFARRCLERCVSLGLGDFDLAYAHEAMARAATAAGDTAAAEQHWSAARAVPITDPEDRAIVEADFADGAR